MSKKPAPITASCQWKAHAAGARDGEARPWESTKDDKIESTDRQIDTLVSPFGDDV